MMWLCSCGPQPFRVSLQLSRLLLEFYCTPPLSTPVSSPAARGRSGKGWGRSSAPNSALPGGTSPPIRKPTHRDVASLEYSAGWWDPETEPRSPRLGCGYAQKRGREWPGSGVARGCGAASPGAPLPERSARCRRCHGGRAPSTAPDRPRGSPLQPPLAKLGSGMRAAPPETPRPRPAPLCLTPAFQPNLDLWSRRAVTPAWGLSRDSCFSRATRPSSSQDQPLKLARSLLRG